MLAAIVSAFISAMIASAVLGHGSGTLFGTLIALPFLVLPGALVVWQARARWFVIWAMISLIASIGWVMVDDPSGFERSLSGWTAVEVSMWTTMSITTTGAWFGAFYLGARPRTADDLDSSLLARRLRRVVRLVIPLAIIAGVFGLFYGQRVYAGSLFLYERRAGGGFLIAFLALMLVPGVIVYRDPRKRWAWLWLVWCLPTAILVLVAMMGFHLFTRGEDMWPLVIVRWVVLMILALLVAGLPLIALITREREPATLPEARVHTS